MRSCLDTPFGARRIDPSATRGWTVSLGLCVVGCGNFARTFAKAVRDFEPLAGSDGVRLLFSSRDASRAEAYCRMFEGDGFFGSYEEASADPTVDALYLCTPHHLHLEHTEMAARNSKHVLVEKPIATNLEEARRMIAAAAEWGVTLMVAENYRFIPVVQEARRLIDRGALGTLRFIQSQQESAFSVEGWRADAEMMGGGIFIDGGIHAVDLLHYLGGRVEEVHASFLPKSLHSLEREDGMVLTARLEGGGTGLINHSWGVSLDSWRLWVSVSGTQGRLYFEPGDPALEFETSTAKNIIDFPGDRRGIGAMVREFAASIREDRSPLTPGEVGVQDLKVVLGAYQSASLGRPVTIE